MSKRQTAGYKRQLFALDISFLGWAVLAVLPVIAESYLYSFQSVAVQFGMEPFLPVLSDSQYFFWMLFTGLWQIGISLLYLPNYYCACAAYYEIAKSTSGIRPEDLATPDPDTF